MELQLYFTSWHNLCKIQKVLPPNIQTDAVDGSRLDWTALPAVYGLFLQLNISFNESWNQKSLTFQAKADTLSFIHTNSCTFSYNYVSVF